MKKTNLLYYLLFATLFFISCSEKNPVEPTGIPSETHRSIDGRIALASNTISLPELNILSFQEEDDIKADNSFDIDVNISGAPQMIFAVNDNNDLVLGATVLGNINSVILSERSTANTFILLNPIFMFADNQQIAEILTNSSKCASYEKLVQLVTKIINDDPANVYNADKYPKTLELSACIGYELLQKYGSNSESSLSKINGIQLGTVAPSVSISSSKKSNVVFSNPNYVALSAEILDHYDYKREQIFSMAPKANNFVSFQFGWPPVYWTQPKKTDISFEKYISKSLTIRATKGFDLAEKSNWFDYSTVTGRASILNMLIVTKQIVKFFLGGAVTTTLELAAEKIKLDLPATQQAIDRYHIAVANNNKTEAAKAFFEIIYINRVVIIGSIATAATVAGGWDAIKSILDRVKKFVPWLSVVSMIYQGATEIIPIVTDLTLGETWYDYRIKTNDKGNVTSCSFQDESSPEIPIVIGKLQVKGSIFKDLGLWLFTHSDDNIRSKIKYHVKVKVNRVGVIPSYYDYYSEFLDIGANNHYYIDEWYGTLATSIYVKVQAENEAGFKSDWSEEYRAK